MIKMSTKYFEVDLKSQRKEILWQNLFYLIKLKLKNPQNVTGSGGFWEPFR